MTRRPSRGGSHAAGQPGVGARPAVEVRLLPRCEKKGKREKGDRERGRKAFSFRSPCSLSIFPFLFSILIASGLVTLLFLLPVGAQNNSPAYLPVIGRNASAAAWPVVPTPTPPPTLRPSPTPGPTATPTLAPADVRVTSSSSFTKTLGAETYLFIVGEVRNVGPGTAIRDLHVIATLLNDEGEYVRHTSEPAYQSMLGPSEIAPFQIRMPLPADYATHRLHVDYRLTSETPPPTVTPRATNVYVDNGSGWWYFLGEIRNTTRLNLTAVQAVVTLYNGAGDVINVADSGRGANSLYEDVIGMGQQRPFRIVLRHGPSDYVSLHWQVTYQAAEGSAPMNLPVRVGYEGQNTGELRNEKGEIIGTTRWFDLYGEVENTTEVPIRAVRVYAAFYREDGRLMNAGLTHTLHGRLGYLAPGQRTPFRLNVKSGLIPDTDTPRLVGATYEPAGESSSDQITISTRRAYHETSFVKGTPVEWLNVVGKVRNDTAETVQDVRAVATFYDDTGRVINAFAGQTFQPTLSTGTASPFKIRTASGPMAYDHFAVDVTAQPARGDEELGLVVDVQAPMPHATPAMFRGEVRNVSSETARDATVFIALYNADGQILAAESQVVADELPAGASAPFSLRVEQATDEWQTYDIGAVSN